MIIENNVKKQNAMEGKILGITLSTLGVLGLLVAIFYMNAVESSKDVNFLLGCGFFGAVLFFAGIWLLPGKRPVSKAIEASPMAKESEAAI
jgi:hypothetical protein